MSSKTSVSAAILALLTLACCETTAFAQTIQLPVQRRFGVNTVVSVPDGGTISLGGNSGYAGARSSRGVPLLGSIPGTGRLFRNQAIGHSYSPARITTSVQIISLRELEQQVLAEAAARTGGFRGPEFDGSQLQASYRTPNSGFSEGHVLLAESRFRSRAQTTHAEIPPNASIMGGNHDKAPTRTPDDNQAEPALTNGELISNATLSQKPPQNRTRGNIARKMINPNGSPETRRKADFISRNIGRKKQ